MRISDWSSDVCSSDLQGKLCGRLEHAEMRRAEAERRAANDVAHRRIARAHVRLDGLSRHLMIEGCADIAVVGPFGVGLKPMVYELHTLGREGGLGVCPAVKQIGSAPCRERVCQYVSI